MAILKQKLLPLLIVLAVVFSIITTNHSQALTYEEAQQGQGMNNATSYIYPTGSLVNDGGAIYFISGTTKIPFTNWQAFVGLGYSLKNVVSGSLAAYTLSPTYFITTASEAHPWGQFLLYNRTIYYSDQSGLLGVPSWDIFLSNGGSAKWIVKANSYDIAVLKAKPNLSLLTANDQRLSSNSINPVISIITPTPTPSATVTVAPTPTVSPTPTPTPTLTTSTSSAETINTLNYFLNSQNQTLTGTHTLSQIVSGQTIYNVKWANDAYEAYSYDNNYIYLKEDHSGSPNPGSYTFSDGKWMKVNMQVGEQINVNDNYLQNFSVNTSSCTPSTTAAFPYVMTLLQHISNYSLGGSLGTQDVIVLQYDYRNGAGTDYEKSYYAKGWGLVKWELYRNGQIVQTSTFNQTSAAAPIVPNLQIACVTTPVTPAIPTSLNNFVNTLYSCVEQNSLPDTSGFNYWLQNLQSGALNVKGAYTQFFNIQNGLQVPMSNDMFAKLLYRCVLFREVDTASYNNVISGLSNSSLTRSGLVQTVLNSSEFNTNILPKLQVLLPNVPTPTPTANPNAPTIPTSLSSFISTLYSCVLNANSPDGSGFNFWLNNLQTHALTVQGAYTQFFGYQSGVTPVITNDQFTQKLYGCILFRPSDQTSYNNVMAGLSNGTLTQANLVQTVLNSSEFTAGILPKLQQLIP